MATLVQRRECSGSRSHSAVELLCDQVTYRGESAFKEIAALKFLLGQASDPVIRNELHF